MKCELHAIRAWTFWKGLSWVTQSFPSLSGRLKSISTLTKSRCDWNNENISRLITWIILRVCQLHIFTLWMEIPPPALVYIRYSAQFDVILYNYQYIHPIFFSPLVTSDWNLIWYTVLVEKTWSRFKHSNFIENSM